MACCGAREIRDGDVVVVGTGFPTMSANIAKYTHAPKAVMMQESGVYDARPRRPAPVRRRRLPQSRAAMIGGLVDIMGMFLQGGWIDVGFLSGSQVDRFGNINTTCIGPYDRPVSRLPGRRRQSHRVPGEAHPHHRPHHPARLPARVTSSRRPDTSTAPGPGRGGTCPPARVPRSSSQTRRSSVFTRRRRRPAWPVIIPGCTSTKSAA
jgi:hypothetical protein